MSSFVLSVCWYPRHPRDRRKIHNAETRKNFASAGNFFLQAALELFRACRVINTVPVPVRWRRIPRDCCCELAVRSFEPKSHWNSGR
jgi:hypothetical protein